MASNKRSVKFVDAQDAESTADEKKKFRKSQYPGPEPQDSKASILSRPSMQDLSARTNVASTRKSARITQMFSGINIRRDRQSTVIRPIESLLPTYRMESKKPFDPRIVEDFLQVYLESELDNHGRFEFSEPVKMNALTRSISEEILAEIKSFGFDRYKIFVAVTIAEKRFQGFNTSSGFIWDIENDGMATCVYERGNIFAFVNVIGVYYD